MNIDIKTLAEGIGLLKSAISTAKQVIDLLPDSSQKDDAAAALKQAERQLKTAEADTAKGLGYEICRAHFPPGVMLSKGEMAWECPECGNKKDRTPRGGII